MKFPLNGEETFETKKCATLNEIIEGTQLGFTTQSRKKMADGTPPALHNCVIPEETRRVSRCAQNRSERAVFRARFRFLLAGHRNRRSKRAPRTTRVARKATKVAVLASSRTN